MGSGIRNRDRARPGMALSLLTSLLGALAIVGPGCAEHLPAYEKPDILIDAVIRADSPRQTDMVIGGGLGTFGVDVRNLHDASGIDQFYLDPPYRVHPRISIKLARDPARRIDLERDVLFSRDADRLGPGKVVRVELDLPARDENGYTWNWGKTDVLQHELLLQGQVEIPELNLKLNTPQVRVRLVYPPPA